MPESGNCRIEILVLALAISCSGCGHLANSQKAYEHARETYLRGDLTKARDEADAAYRRLASRDQEWAWKFRLLEAEILLDQGSSKEVLSLLETSLPVSLADSNLAIKQLTLRGSAYAQLDRFQESDERLKEAGILCQQSGSSLAGEIARARGVLEVHRHDPEKAGGFFRESLRLSRQLNDRHLELTDLLNLGTVAMGEERYDQSIDWSNDAYRTAEILGDESTGEAALGNLGWAYYKMGDFDKALALYQEAEKTARGLGAVYDQMLWLNTIGLVYYQLDQLSTAEHYYQQALALAQKNGSPQPVIDALTSLAFVAVQKGRLAEAEQYGEQALQRAHAKNDRVSELYPLLVRGQVAGGRGDHQQAENIFHEVAKDPKSDLSLRWEAQNDLAKLYEQQHQFAAADKQYQRALATLEQARSSLQHEEFKLPFQANATHLYDDYIRFLVAQGKDERALQFADYSRARTLAEGLGILSQKSPALPAALNPQAIARQSNATVLFYWLGRERSYLWAIAAQRTERYTLPPAADIEAAVQRYRQALLGWQDVLKTANPDGRHLYDLLIAPARHMLRHNAPVIVISDGSLDRLNFETLLAPGPPVHYWIEEVTVRNGSSLRLMAASQAKRNNGGGKLLLMGNAVRSSPDYSSLPNALPELEEVAKHFKKDSLQSYTGDRATPAAYLNSRPRQYSFIHFVAHATASKISPLDSAIILSRSSAEQDSFKLYARDITHQALNANLVTISSCYGAGAKAYSGEGLVGLSWAFLRAGAHNVIGALWEVNDASTATLMGHLYDGLQHGQSPEAALRSAKLALLHSGEVVRKPFYWAPFQLYTGR